MMKILQPNKEVTDILTDIIKDSRDLWASLGGTGNTYEDFMNLELPDGDVPNANCINDIINILDNKHREKYHKCISLLGVKKYTNAMVYRPGGIMGWHTNSNSTGTRIYYTFTAGDAYFRYVDNNTKDKILSKDNIGWTVREFKITQKDPLWHCVWSEKLRFSFGFNSRDK